MNKKQPIKTKNSWEYPKCNLCLSNNPTVLYNDLTYWEYPGVFRVVRCSKCSFVYLHPRPSLSAIGKYYESDNYFGRDISDLSNPSKDDSVRKIAYGMPYKVILSKKKKGSILDIGAGTGLFLSFFKEKGWKVDGIELTDEAVDYAKKIYKINLRRGDFFDFTLPVNTYDVVSLNGALEHMYKPYETLVGARKYLKEGGIIIFSVPNVDSLGRKLFGRNWFPWQPPRHLYHFSPTTAREMLKKAGFSNIKIDTNYYVQNKYILFQSLRYSKSPKFQKSQVGGLKDASRQNKKSISPLVITGKIVWNLLSEVIARAEPLFGKGEVMLVYAQK